MPRLPKLPKLLDRKIYKTGQTRGADDDEIYQNRVGRSSTVLIPFSHWSACADPTGDGRGYEKGAICLIDPVTYFALDDPVADLATLGLTLGQNCLLFYRTRAAWNADPPSAHGFTPATSRISPLGGQYVARIPATTAQSNGHAIREGFTSTAMKGAGIRVYEYADAATITATRLQLEALFWLCGDSEASVIQAGMDRADAATRRRAVLDRADVEGLLDISRLREARLVNRDDVTICPLCLEPMSGLAFMSRMEQAAGRESPDLTVTAASLFHVEELRVGILHHKPYNLGWGHHHCNVVAKDAGIEPTIEWMRELVARNDAHEAS